MSRKFAAFIATGVALVVVAGALIALALGHERQPHPAAASTQTSSTPTPTPTAPTATPTNNAPPSTPQTPAGDPTANLVKGNKKVLFFSFDDGPDPVWTPKVLQTLAKYDAKATFFQMGNHQAEHPALKDQILAAGHTIGNHSISHPQLTAISNAERRHQIYDGPKSKCFRPPYGATNPKVRADIKNAGMVQVLWDVDPRDWARPGVNAIVNNILHNAHNHNIILMHDGGGDRTQTVAALDKALRILKGQGYTFLAMDC
ncbi:polysaccharide deacetylase family protein [Kribbella sandramycini]|uniref:Peptidoglycan/xylan/chitin deacetylase (PgdA/CDA1 family) n=1 Tax=Kribbella sandramycini TaxID=60450 RepID=A0A7Y4L6I6_9ACTN|nr:polysaccharide deacetylase family protein [Kribbella sandramycini]MBB6571434.1 peptidoglycan/xylan/chitin deacetylase (PgdA/CDA1 family) [Kribbella sandramycini]NOL44086.1 polysaccharide deacetylase family protein [Kribbella sandramycini]